MHVVVETPTYQRSAERAGLSEDERIAIVSIVASDPMAGDLMEGTGGARKLRIAGRGKGKSGGYRVITFYAADDVPIFLLDLYGKGEKANLTKAERNALHAILSTLAEKYRKSVARKVAALRTRRGTD
ncbi:type II toxin-antitoxin system RelE/ParE family toxin [Methylovirgula sp. HY1]|uniref:type II toxin-antitoxin system RelE/ParE family toxin n=1 Tax=Methylovirgula sp. HY1 TaxID=2822761 RepID=UPI001C5B52B8|nr:type II toxin-antitoxin system RelE/ParE family toxin [Methylovirgula sp. HY1]QXX75292.1 Toxin HigB-2 [Methylovirgula sp. HY1]